MFDTTQTLYETMYHRVTFQIYLSHSYTWYNVSHVLPLVLCRSVAFCRCRVVCSVPRQAITRKRESERVRERKNENECLHRCVAHYDVSVKKTDNENECEDKRVNLICRHLALVEYFTTK